MLFRSHLTKLLRTSVQTQLDHPSVLDETTLAISGRSDAVGQTLTDVMGMGNRQNYNISSSDALGQTITQVCEHETTLDNNTSVQMLPD